MDPSLPAPTVRRGSLSFVDSLPELDDDETVHQVFEEVELVFAVPSPTTDDAAEEDVGDETRVTATEASTSASAQQAQQEAVRSLGVGTLYVTTRRFMWKNVDNTDGADFDASYITLHAVTSDEETFSRPCLYCQLDEEDETMPSECMFVPHQESQLQPLFDAFSHVAMLNPDMGEDDDGGDAFFGLDGDDDDMEEFDEGEGEEEEEDVEGQAIDVSGMITSADQLQSLSEEQQATLEKIATVFSFPGEENNKQ